MNGYGSGRRGLLLFSVVLSRRKGRRDEGGYYLDENFHDKEKGMEMRFMLLSSEYWSNGAVIRDGERVRK